jgi:threonine aldolase
MDIKEIEQVMNNCTRFLSGRYPQSSRPRPVMERLISMITDDQRSDIYGTGDLIKDFEQEIAQLLGKKAAVFMPSGTMAQQIALRIWSERRGCQNVAFHPTCHLEIHENKGYQYLHGLQGVLVGPPEDLLTLKDLQNISQPISTLLLELPQREIGGQLPAWEELVAIADWSKENGVFLHMDGARLWQCKSFYGKEYAEISALFDSVYVSMYKDLGGIAGSVLAGPEDFIAESRIWLRRHGGNLISMYPFVLSARYGLEKYLDQMPAFVQRARQIAAILENFPRVVILPNPPHTNMMHLFIRADAEELEQAHVEFARREKFMLFRRPSPASIPGFQRVEINIHEAAMDLRDDEIQQAFFALFEMLKS